MSVLTLGSAAFLGAPGAIGSFVVLTGAAIAMAPLARAGRNRVVTSIGDEVDGQPITGEAWSLLRDCAVRFEDAKRMIDDVPTGFDWEEIWPDINVLLWETAKHAGRVSALDRELAELRWSAEGTPQAAYREALQRTRDDEYDVMRVAQWEAYSLQREAGNAAAAAKLALMHVGSVDALERVVPSTASITAHIRLAEARARLQMLTEVWAELDPQHRVLEQRVEQSPAPAAIEAPVASEGRRRRRRS